MRGPTVADYYSGEWPDFAPPLTRQDNGECIGVKVGQNGRIGQAKKDAIIVIAALVFVHEDFQDRAWVRDGFASQSGPLGAGKLHQAFAHPQ